MLNDIEIGQVWIERDGWPERDEIEVIGYDDAARAVQYRYRTAAHMPECSAPLPEFWQDWSLKE